MYNYIHLLAEEKTSSPLHWSPISSFGRGKNIISATLITNFIFWPRQRHHLRYTDHQLHLLAVAKTSSPLHWSPISSFGRGADMDHGCDIPSFEQTLDAAFNDQFLCTKWGSHESSAFGILCNVQQEEARLLWGNTLWFTVMIINSTVVHIYTNNFLKVIV